MSDRSYLNTWFDLVNRRLIAHVLVVTLPSRASRARKSQSAEASGSLLRRLPQQARGQRRVDLILRAAAEVIAEAGVEGATTNAIAARARTSVGSLYQFFPNRESIVQALAARYAADFERVKDEVMPLEVAHRPLPEMMRGIVGPIAAFMNGNPAYRHVYPAMNAPVSGKQSPEEACLHESVVVRVEALIERRTPWIDPVQRHATALVQVSTVHAVLFDALILSRSERRRVEEELVRMLVCALEPFDRAGPSRKAR